MITLPPRRRVRGRTLPGRARLSALALLLAFSPAAAQEPETGTFILRQQGQTIATETFRRSGEVLEAELTITNQATLQARGTVRPDATLARLEVRVYGPGGATGEPLQSSGVTFENGVATFEQPLGTAAGQPKEVGSGVVPYVNPSAVFMEQILRRARVVGGDSPAVPVWSPAPGGGHVTDATVVFGDGTATLTMGGVAIDVTTDAVGRLLSARIPSQGLEITRE